MTPNEKLPGRFAAMLRLTPVSFGLLGAYLASQLMANVLSLGSESVLWSMGANNGEAVRAGHYYRLLAATFLHGGWIHLLMNSGALLMFAPLEHVLGARRFLLLYVLSGLGGSVATAFFMPTAVSVGASGAIWGLLGWTFGMRIPQRATLRARGVSLHAGWPVLALNLAISFLPGVDFSAHLGGSLVGFVLGATALLQASGPAQSSSVPARGPRSDWLLSAASIAAALLLTGSFIVALSVGRPWQFSSAPDFRRVPFGSTGLSIELPVLMSEQCDNLFSSDESGATIQYWRCGIAERSPLVLSMTPMDLSPVLVGPARSLPSQDIDQYLKTLLGNIERSPVGARMLRTSLQIISLGEHSVVREELRGDFVNFFTGNLHLRHYYAFVGPLRVQLTFYRQRRWPVDVWPGVEDRIVSSLNYAGR